jgi:hypothetical protein
VITRWRIGLDDEPDVVIENEAADWATLDALAFDFVYWPWRLPLPPEAWQA